MITNSNSNNKPLTSIEGILEGFNIKSLLKRFHFFNRSGTDASIIFEAVFLQAFFGVRNLFRFSQSRHFITLKRKIFLDVFIQYEQLLYILIKYNQ